jgi:hypothetical protein
MSAESAIILAYALVVFAPFLITALVFLGHLKSNYADKTRPVATHQETQDVCL